MQKKTQTHSKLQREKWNMKHKKEETKERIFLCQKKKRENSGIEIFSFSYLSQRHEHKKSNNMEKEKTLKFKLQTFR